MRFVVTTPMHNYILYLPFVFVFVSNSIMFFSFISTGCHWDPDLLAATFGCSVEGILVFMSVSDVILYLLNHKFMSIIAGQKIPLLASIYCGVIHFFPPFVHLWGIKLIFVFV